MLLQEFIAENYLAAWNDFLSNKRDSALTRTRVGLQRVAQLKSSLPKDSDAAIDLLVTEVSERAMPLKLAWAWPQ